MRNANGCLSTMVNNPFKRKFLLEKKEKKKKKKKIFRQFFPFLIKLVSKLS